MIRIIIFLYFCHTVFFFLHFIGIVLKLRYISIELMNEVLLHREKILKSYTQLFCSFFSALLDSVKLQCSIHARRCQPLSVSAESNAGSGRCVIIEYLHLCPLFA
jgi:hypothetical protein